MIRAYLCYERFSEHFILESWPVMFYDHLKERPCCLLHPEGFDRLNPKSLYCVLDA